MAQVLNYTTYDVILNDHVGGVYTTQCTPPKVGTADSYKFSSEITYLGYGQVFPTDQRR